VIVAVRIRRRGRDSFVARVEAGTVVSLRVEIRAARRVLLRALSEGHPLRASEEPVYVIGPAGARV
jgi:hypothetical protein